MEDNNKVEHSSMKTTRCMMLHNNLPENNEAHDPETPFSIKLNCSTPALPLCKNKTHGFYYQIGLTGLQDKFSLRLRTTFT